MVNQTKTNTKKRFGAPPPSSPAQNIDDFINGSVTESMEQSKLEQKINEQTISVPIAPVVLEQETPNDIQARGNEGGSSTTIQQDAAKPKRGRPAGSKKANANQKSDEEEEGPQIKFLFGMSVKESNKLREFAYEHKRNKADVIRQALTEFYKRNP